MTAALSLYAFATRVLEPAAPILLRRRARQGKERLDRLGERLGHTSILRPEGPLLWMHGASVGESRLLLDLFETLRTKRPNLSAVLTTQTLTSADMIVARRVAGVIHQMAPVDAPGAVKRFLAHWRPDAAVFAEGEIWPNMLRGLKAAGVPGALANARMTAKSLASWRSRAATARELFSAFRFIGAADGGTAEGLGETLARPISTVGNLKRASPAAEADPAAVDTWRRALKGRPALVAASTHPGEDELALAAFAQVRRTWPEALLIIAPRHPDRGVGIANLAAAQGFTAIQRSLDRAMPSAGIDVLVADTMGEMPLWYTIADAIYLGGANAEGIGGHNPIEPAQAGKRVFTGPHGFNFRETFEELSGIGAVTIGTDADDLARWWLANLGGASGPDAAAIAQFLGAGRAPFDATIDAILALLPPELKSGPAHA